MLDNKTNISDIKKKVRPSTTRHIEIIGNLLSIMNDDYEIELMVIDMYNDDEVSLNMCVFVIMTRLKTTVVNLWYKDKLTIDIHCRIYKILLYIVHNVGLDFTMGTGTEWSILNNNVLF